MRQLESQILMELMFIWGICRSWLVFESIVLCKTERMWSVRFLICPFPPICESFRKCRQRFPDAKKIRQFRKNPKEGKEGHKCWESSQPLWARLYLVQPFLGDQYLWDCCNDSDLPGLQLQGPVYPTAVFLFLFFSRKTVFLPNFITAKKDFVSFFFSLNQLLELLIRKDYFIIKDIDTGNLFKSLL